MQTPKSRTGPSDVAQRISPQTARCLKTPGSDSDPVRSPNPTSRTPKDRSPKVVDRRSPQSPVSEKKRPSKVPELESQLTQLQEELKKSKEQLSSSEYLKKRAQEEAQEAKKQLAATSTNQLAVQKQHAMDSAAFSSAMNEIRKLQMQLERVSESEEALRSEGLKAMDDCRYLAMELEQSKARVNLLEEVVRKLKTNNLSNHSPNGEGAQENGEDKDSDQLKAEVNHLKFEVIQLRFALDAAERRYEEEYIQSTLQIRRAYELGEHAKSESSMREAELESKLKVAKADNDELEAKLQSMYEENNELRRKIEENHSSQRDSKLEMQIEVDLAQLKACLLDKEKELSSITKENEMLKLEIEMREMERNKVNDDAITKLSCLREEADKSSRKVDRVIEQLNASEAANSEMELEMRRLKVQCDQWRKAAEAAAAILSTGDEGTLGSPFFSSEDLDDESLKKKNGNMLKKIGILLKKGQK